MFFSNTNDTHAILSMLEQFESYIKGDINSVNLNANSIKDKNLHLIADKIVSIANEVAKGKESDLKVFGEIMLVCEKLSDGYTDDLLNFRT